MKTFTALLITILFSTSLFSQDYSNKGKEFWIAYSSHIDATASVMGIYITSDKNATGNIGINGTNIPFTVTAKQVTTKFIGTGAGFDGSNNYVYLDMQDGIKTNGAIHITADVPIVVYAHIIRSARSAATLVLPTQVLGTEYIIPSHQSSGGNSGAELQGIGLLSVIATQPNTVVEINPTINGRGGKLAGIPFQVTLANTGDCYQFHGVQNADISGTTVKSISTSTTGCKPIAVFAATTWSAFDCNGSSGGDNLYQQLFPVKSWGKQFITAPFKNRNYDIYRIYVKDTATVVTLTDAGVPQIMGGAQYNKAGRFYEHKTSNSVYISADKPISVVQYITSTTCKNGCNTNSNTSTCYSDPEMVLLNPIEQTLKDVTFFSAHQNFVPSGQSNVALHFVNIIIDNKFKNSVKIDGTAPKGTFVNIPSTNYSYLQEDLTTSSATNPVHNIVADTGFSAIVYGYGQVESYGYNGGTNIVDLYQYVTLQNQYATVNFPATCKNTPFNFSITLPYQPLKMVWDFNNSPNLSPNLPYTNNTPVYDSTFIKDGKILYVYKIPNTYIFNKIGSYNIKVTVNNPSADGCVGDQEIYYQVEVYDPPIASFHINTNGCTSSPVNFNDNSQTFGRATIKWIWDFGDGTKDSIANPIKNYTAGGTFPLKFSIITDVGCLADTTKDIVLAVPPTAKFGFSNPNICANKAVTIIDSSTVTAPNNIAKWYWDFGNGTKDTATVSKTYTLQYSDTGIYTITLWVESNGGCKSIMYSKTIKVGGIPIVGFTLPEVCLNDAFAQFNDTSKIIDNSTLNYTWNFGDKNSSSINNTSTLKNPTHKYIDTGVYNVQLIVTSKDFCIDSLTQKFTVNGGSPKANFAVLNAANLCSNDSVKIQNTSIVDFGNITAIEIEWDTANNLAHKTIDNNPYPNKIYSTTYTPFSNSPTKPIYVKMYSYSGSSCVNAKTVLITLHQIPAIQFTNIPSICNEATPRIITQASEISGASGLGIFSGTGIVNASTGLFNPQSLATGVYTIKYTFTTNNFACVSVDSNTIIILPSPIAKFGLGNILCEKNSSLFIDSSTTNIGTITKWEWDFDNGTTATKLNADTFSVKYSNAQTYFASLKITTDSGCVNTISKPVKINYLPKVKFGLPKSICLPDGKGLFIDSTTITDNSGSFGYLWNFGDKNDLATSTLQNPTHKYSDTANVDITLIVTSKYGCVDSLTKKLTTIYPQPKAKFTIAPDTSICFGDELKFTDLSDGLTSNINKWFWNLGFGYSSTQQNPKQTYSDSGIATVSLYTYNAENCVSDTFKKTIIVNPYPIIKLPATLNFLQGGLLTIQPIYYYGQNLSYLWTPNQFIISDTALFAQVYPENDKRYYLKVTGAGNCSDTASVNVIVLRLPQIPNVFSPNNDGVNDFWVIENLESYPGCTIQIFDRYGKKVYSSLGYTKNWDGKSNGNPLPTGTYYYIIDPKNGRQKLSGSITILR
ncbi:MAG: PKD domain-containing protein [Chitinophagaceae bacterium]